MITSRRQQTNQPAPYLVGPAPSEVVGTQLRTLLENSSADPAEIVAILSQDPDLENLTQESWELLKALLEPHDNNHLSITIIHRWLIQFALRDRLSPDLKIARDPDIVSDEKVQLQMEVLLYWLSQPGHSFMGITDYQSTPHFPQRCLLRLLGTIKFNPHHLQQVEEKGSIELRRFLPSTTVVAKEFSEGNVNQQIKKNLLLNYIYFEVMDNLKQRPNNELHQLVKLSGAFTHFEKREINFVSDLSQTVINNWVINSSEQADTAIMQIIDLILAPHIFKKLIQNDGQKTLATKLNEIIRISGSVFYRTFFRALWDLSNERQPKHTCDLDVREWLFNNVDTLRGAGYIVSNQAFSDGKNIVVPTIRNISSTGIDTDKEIEHKERKQSFSDKTREVITRSKKIEPHAITLLDAETIRILEIISSSQDANFVYKLFSLHFEQDIGHTQAKSPLFEALTSTYGDISNEYSERFYQNCKFMIIHMLNHPNFDLGLYYDNASSVFKNLPEVIDHKYMYDQAEKSKQQLSRLFNPDLTVEQLNQKNFIKEKAYQNYDFFIKQLMTTYSNNITYMSDNLPFNNTPSATAERDYQRIRRLNKIIQKLPPHTLATLLENQPIFNKFFLTYRITKYQKELKSRENPDPTTGKLAKTNVLIHIWKNLNQLHNDSIVVTNHRTTPFLWQEFCNWKLRKLNYERRGITQSARAELIRYTSEKQAELECWLRDTILGSNTGSEFAVTVSYFPEGLTQTIFDGTNITPQEIWAAAHGSKAYPKSPAQRFEYLNPEQFQRRSSSVSSTHITNAGTFGRATEDTRSRSFDSLQGAECK